MGAWTWAGEKLVLTELEGRFRDTCFCGRDGMTSRASDPSPHLAKGGSGWGDAGTLKEIENGSSRLDEEGSERSHSQERERAWEDLVELVVPRTTPPTPLSAREAETDDEIGMRVELCSKTNFITSPAWTFGGRRTRRT